MKTKLLMKMHAYAKALANHRNSHNLNSNNQVWAYYNLGMYKTASRFSNNGLKCKGLVAKIISLSACGEFEKAKDTLKHLQNNFTCKSLYIRLIDSLAPFMPKTAYNLTHNLKVPLVLSSAIELKLGKKEKAFATLEKAIAKKEYRTTPELLLYYANAHDQISPTFATRLMNMYLLAFGLPKLKLKDKNKPLSTLNISCKYDKRSSGPLVTIIMTTYKTGDRANIAIESILNQSYQNIELIVVDDASGDDTANIVKKWIQKDERVKLIELPKNVGTYVAKNLALLQCKGEFVTCHDSDDWSHPLKIEQQVRPLLRNSHLVATISSWVRLSDEGEFYARPVHPLTRQNPSSLLFRKEKVLKHAGIWDCVRTGADSEYISRLKLVFGRLKIKRIKKPLSFGAHREDSLMNAADTGYCDMGMSPQRLEYWESWGKWHIDTLSTGGKPFIPSNLLAERAFDAPRSIEVDPASIKEIIDSLKNE